MKRIPLPKQPDDRRLQSILHCIRDGLRKLIPTAPEYGHPPFTRLAMTNSEHSPTYSAAWEPFLVASLSVWYSPTQKEWLSAVSVADGDDFLLQRFLTFTWDHWVSQINLYDQVTSFDQDTHSLLIAEGFS